MASKVYSEPLFRSVQSNLWLKDVEYKLPDDSVGSCTKILKDKYHLLTPNKAQTPAMTVSSPSPFKPLEINRGFTIIKKSKFDATIREPNKILNGSATSPLNGSQELPSPPSKLPNGNVISHENGSGETVKSQVSKTIITSTSTASVIEIPRPKFSIDVGDKLILQWPNIRPIGPGLDNLGNSCFMNSVIQCLTYCPPLVMYLMKGNHGSRCTFINSCMACQLQRHISVIYDHKLTGNRVICPKGLHSKLKLVSKSFNYGRQEDAHEYLRQVIDNMCKMAVSSAERRKNDGSFGTSFKFDARSKETTIFNHIFGGHLRSQITCLNCNSTFNTFDHFLDLMLDIKNADSLLKALNKFISPEKLQDENCYKCATCKKRSEATKKFTIHSPPNVLTIQLKRFEYNRFIGKITRYVQFEEELNLKPFMSNPSQHSDIIYKLFAVLVHSGSSCNSGHYFSYVKNSNRTWYRMDDAMVTMSQEAEVLRQNAYILFYVRQPTTGLSNGLSNGLKSNSLLKFGYTNSIRKEVQSDKLQARKVEPIFQGPKILREKSHSTTPDKVQTSTVTASTSSPSKLGENDRISTSGKRKFDATFPELVSPSISNQVSSENVEIHMNGFSNTGNSDVTKMNGTSIRNYGPNVKSWSGNSNLLDEEVEKDKRKDEEMNRENDEYDREFDAGKTKKVKSKNSELGNGLLFQKKEEGVNEFDFYKKKRNGPFQTHHNGHGQFNHRKSFNGNGGKKFWKQGPPKTSWKTGWSNNNNKSRNTV